MGKKWCYVIHVKTSTEIMLIVYDTNNKLQSWMFHILTLRGIQPGPNQQIPFRRLAKHG